MIGMLDEQCIPVKDEASASPEAETQHAEHRELGKAVRDTAGPMRPEPQHTNQSTNQCEHNESDTICFDTNHGNDNGTRNKERKRVQGAAVSSIKRRALARTW